MLLIATPAAAAQSWLDPDAADAATAAADPDSVVRSSEARGESGSLRAA